METFRRSKTFGRSTSSALRLAQPFPTLLPVVSRHSSKPAFSAPLRTIAALHRRGAGGIRIALTLTQALDETIRLSFRALPHSEKNLICLVALGGYGRKELCFASDTDIMFLVPEHDPMNQAAMAVQKLLHQLLDLGLDIGHSARTISDCIAMRDSDVESWVSLVESRFLIGNKGLFQQFRKSLGRQISTSDHAALIKDLVTRADVRNHKYGSSTKLLEPNIKNSAGGLRDLHTVLWLILGTGMMKIPAILPKHATALTSLLESPHLKNLFTVRHLGQTRRALDFLLRTRNEMHIQSKGLHDSLEFAFQSAIAEALEYESTPTRPSVERFMQDYYVASRQVARFTRRATAAVQQAFRRTTDIGKPQKLDRFFQLRDGVLTQRTSATRRPNEFLLTACLHARNHSAPFSEDLEDWIGKNVDRFTSLKSKSESTLFRSLITAPSGVGNLLHQLSEEGVLERWIPEWKAMVAFFQHNQYHYYTADEHTLRVIQNAEALATQQGSFASVYRSLPRKDLLVLACLLHDIAKPKRVSTHEVTGALMTRKILKRFGYTDIRPDVEFLVRYHLLMEQTAFRRNLSDAQTIIDFASKFKNPILLDYLFVLTYADLSAVNKNVWSDWKGMLLYELYRKCREILDQRLTSEQVHTAARSRHEAALKELVETLAETVPEDSSRTHLEAVDSPAYLAAFDAQEIAEHIRHIERNQPVSTIFKHLPDVTEITIIAKDAPSILSKFCGVLSANDANIFDAHVFTRSDGIVIDKFRVIGFVSRTSLNNQQSEKIHKELNDVVMGSVGMERLLERHRMKWRRLSRSHSSNTHAAVEFENHPRYTIIDVFAPDRLGFLYKITEAISRLGLDISFAKIATRADGIVDSFYVRDTNGAKIASEGQMDAVRSALLETIQTVVNSELVQNE